MSKMINLNADIAEGWGAYDIGNDADLMKIIKSASIACGFHAGDSLTIRTTVARCVELGVVIGAQVSYRDLAGFGRRAMDVEPDDLEADVLYQIAAVDGLARVAGSGVAYLKPHGALYHRTLTDEGQAAAVVAAVVAWNPAMPVLTMTDGALARAATAAGLSGLRLCRKGRCRSFRAGCGRRARASGS